MSIACNELPGLVKNGSFVNVDSCSIICIPNFGRVIMNNQSIFFGGSPMDSLFGVFMAQAILAFVVSRLVYFLLRPLRQPRIVCNILAGVIMGPSVLGRSKTFTDLFFPKNQLLVFNTLAPLGAAFYTFIVAIKMDTSVILRTAKTAWVIGLCSYIVPFAVIQLFCLLIDGEHDEAGPIMDLSSFFLALSFSTTYFPIIAHIMEEYDLMTTELGRVVMTSALLNEFFTHTIATAANIVDNKNFVSSFQSSLITIGPIIVVFIAVGPAIQLIIKRTPEGKPVHEFYTNALMIGGLIMGFVSDYVFGYVLPGPLLLGLIIPDGPPLGSTIVEKYELITMEILLPFFFIKIGLETDVTSVKNLEYFLFTLLFTVICFVAKTVGTMVAASYLNIRVENSFLIGIIMNFRGVFELSLYEYLVANKAMDQGTFTILVIFSILFNGVFCPFINIIYDPQVRLINPNPNTTYLRTLQSTPLGSELHVLISIYNEDNVHGFINLLKAFNPNSVTPISADVIHAIELVGQNTPSLHPYSIYGKRFKNNTSQKIFLAFMNYAKNSNGLVSIHPFSMIAPYKTMDNIICNLAEDRKVPLIVIPFDKKYKNLLSGFNSRLQGNAPCTVGILVQKGLKARANSSFNEFSCSLLLLFIGGEDDREALALALRMSKNPDVTVTLLRVISPKQSGNNMEILEKNLDDLSINEFLERNRKNSWVTYNEIVANSSSEFLDVLRSFEDNYDLVMVGKNPTKTQFQIEMVQWMENQELGVIGDLFASWKDSYYSRNMSILIIQHCRKPNQFVISMYTSVDCNTGPLKSIV
ncbi:cation/H(+) antiporter 15-like [Mercurialis annua]|uniref:cation/H(+) antiporter 15-like n=1 Tax=Mercurialis annua TaxID=3986 RepID=UPI0024AFC6B9|nr:cation/H(+) antiporter 15-like [Mercurialis annua]